MRKQLRFPTLMPSADRRMWKSAGRWCGELACPVIPFILRYRGKPRRVLVAFLPDNTLRAELLPRGAHKLDRDACELVRKMLQHTAWSNALRSEEGACVSLGREPGLTKPAARKRPAHPRSKP